MSITGTGFDVGGSTAGTQKGYRGYGVSGQTWITVDGVSTTEGTSGAGMYYDYSAFSEITVQAAANSAEVAVPGVYTNTVMKTGGNALHGSGYIDWEKMTFYSEEASAVGSNQCPNCGGVREFVGKGVIKCPYCGVSLFIPPTAEQTHADPKPPDASQPKEQGAST